MRESLTSGIFSELGWLDRSNGRDEDITEKVISSAEYCDRESAAPTSQLVLRGAWTVVDRGK